MWQLAAQAGISALGGILGRSGAKRAARERAAAYGDASNMLGTAYNESAAFLDPRLQQEQAAMGGVNALLGLGGQAPDYSLFQNAPGYQYQLEQGQQAIERSAAARGGLASGNTLIELQRHAQGQADMGFQNYLNTLLGLQGQGVDMTLAGMRTNLGGQQADMRLGAGGARASGIEDATNAINAGISGIGTAVSGWQGRNQLAKLLKG